MKDNTASAGIISVAGMLIARFAAFASALIVAPTIGPAGYGIFVLTRDLCLSITVVTKLGLDFGLTRWIAERRNEKGVVKGYYLSSMIISFSLSFLFALGFWLGGADWLEEVVYRYDGIALIFCVMATIIVLVTMMNMMSGSLRGMLNIKASIMSELIIQPVSRILLIIALFVFDTSIWSVIIATILSYLFAVLYAGKKLHGTFANAGVNVCWPKWGEVFSLVSYSLYMTMTLAIALLLQRVDIFMLGYFTTAEDVGVYAIVLLAVPVIGLINNALSQRLAPQIAIYSAENKQNELRDAVSQHVDIVLILTVPIYAIFMTVGADLITIVGEEYRVEPTLMWMLSSAYFVQASVSSCGFLLSMTGAFRKELPVLLVALILNGLMNYFWIPAYGTTGAAAATLVSLVVSNSIRVIIIYKIYNFFPIGNRAYKTLIIGLIPAWFIYMYRQYTGDYEIISAVYTGALYIIVYGAACYYFLLSVQEKMWIQKFSKKLCLSLTNRA